MKFASVYIIQGIIMAGENIFSYQEPLNNLRSRLEGVLSNYSGESELVDNELRAIQDLYKLKVNNLKPQIMMYGIYNAGKSSVINALIGKDVAKVADIPTTDNVDLYQWHEYEIADTPGIEAPIEDEMVTEEHLRRADVVLFVMSNTGSHDKASNYERMKKVDRSGKQLIVILNDKQGNMMEEGLLENNKDLCDISAKVRKNLQDFGVKQDCKIVCVNADMARDARVAAENEDDARWLLENSGIENLKKVILSELKKSSSFKILKNTVFEIEQGLDKIIKELAEGEQSKGIQHLNEMLDIVREQKISLRKEMKGYVSQKAIRLGKELPNEIWANKENQEAVENLIQEKVANIAKSAQGELEDKMQEIQDLLDVEMKKLITSLDKICSRKGYSVSVNGTDVEEVKPVYSGEGMNISKEDIDKVLEAGKQMYDIYQKSQLSLKLPVVYSQLPTLLGNIGVNAAGSVASKAVSSIVGSTAGKLLGAKVAAGIPYIGPLIAIASTVLPFILGDNGAEQRARQEAEVQNEYNRRKMEAEIQARQDLRQKCEYMAEDISDELSHNINVVINEIIGSLEDNLKQELAKNEDIMNSRTADIAELRDISSEYNTMMLQLGNA